jgi:DNA polymerase-1
VELALPFREIWALDFEYNMGDLEPKRDGNLQVPVCMVAREVRTGQLIRTWQGEFPDQPPFDVGPRSLFLAYYASAEWNCFLALGWQLPTHCIDLYAEYRAMRNSHVDRTNPRARPGHGLIDALAAHGLDPISKTEKNENRDLILRGGPWSDAEKERILDYCQSDVDPLAELFKRMAPRLLASEKILRTGVLRGRYTQAVARMETAGIPVDVTYLTALRKGWGTIQLDVIAEVDEAYGVYDGTTFKRDRFAEYLAAQGIRWPRTDAGNLVLDSDTFKDMARTYPQLEPLRGLRDSIAQMRAHSLAVGDDGRNRAMLGAFGSATARNQPSNAKFIFGPSAWLRGLIKPPEGRAVAYIDWSAQEVAIAAALSGDPGLLNDIRSGDPYLSFAVRAGLAPADATKASHKTIRDQCKACVLGVNYGMGVESLAVRIGRPIAEAAAVLSAFYRAYPVYTEWSARVIDMALLRKRQVTKFGWPIRVTGGARPTSIKNYPMQANGAEMMRQACIRATEAGVTVAAPVHDALLIESDACNIDNAVAVTQAAMDKAARAVLGDFTIKTDVVVVRWPDRYADPRGRVMWDRVIALLVRHGLLESPMA